jgi:molecular chaperone GrpE (heat shock protein)
MIMKIFYNLVEFIKSPFTRKPLYFKDSDSVENFASFSEICKDLKRITELTTGASHNLNKLLLDLEDYGAGSWNREREAKNKYLRVINSLFLILDHFENMNTNNGESDEIGWFIKMVKRILEDEGIEEIPIKVGDVFNSKYHKQVGNRTDEHEEGSILEISRKGYISKSQEGKKVVAVLRPAEVIVSNGKTEKHSENEFTEE